VRQSAAHVLGQYESNILVSGLFLGLSYNDIFVKRKSISVNGYYCNEEAKKKPIIKNTILFICPVRRANNPSLKIFIRIPIIAIKNVIVL
jgi:hypothetical protein